MVVNIVRRLMSLEEVPEVVSALRDADLDCILLVPVGVDAATRFSQYSERDIMAKENSLLAECMLPLTLES